MLPSFVVPSPASDVSLCIRWRTPATNASRMSRLASRHFPPDAQKMANWSQHVEKSCERPPARDATILPAPDTLPWPNVCLDHHRVAFLFSGIADPTFSLLYCRIHGKKQRDRNNANDDEFGLCEPSQQVFWARPLL